MKQYNSDQNLLSPYYCRNNMACKTNSLRLHTLKALVVNRLPVSILGQQILPSWQPARIEWTICSVRSLPNIL